MTYDELLQMFLANGGSFDSINPVNLPDGGRIDASPLGTLNYMQPNVATVNGEPGRMYDSAMLGGPSGQSFVSSADSADNWRRALAGVLAVGVGGPVAGGLASGAIGGAGAGSLGALGTAADPAVIGAIEAGTATSAAAPAASGLFGAGTAAMDGAALMPGASMTSAGAAPAATAVPAAAGATSMFGSAGSAPASGGMFSNAMQAAGLMGDGGSDWTSLLARYGPGIAGAALGALGSGDRTQSVQNLIDPAQRAYLLDFQQRAGAVANQPYQAPGFSLTQGPTAAQGAGIQALQAALDSPMTGLVNQTLGGFMDNSRGGTAAANPYVGLDNPELMAQIDAAQGDLARNFNNVVAPRFAAGSSFGNSGLGQLEVDTRNDLMNQMGRVGSDMRYQNYALQAGLAESGAARADSMFNNNAARALQAAGLGQQGVAQQGALAGNLFGAGATLWNQGQQNTANQYQEFGRQQDWSRNQLSAMNPGLGVNMGTTQAGSVSGNPWAGALGGWVMGNQIANGGLFGNGSRPSSVGAGWG